jgi:hypothetical protein
VVFDESDIHRWRWRDRAAGRNGCSLTDKPNFSVLE